MYQDFYSLRENPFSVTADPDYFFESKFHTEALSVLRYGIEERKGFILITGEVGTGKTMLCRKLLRDPPHKTKFAFILNPNYSQSDLLHMIAHDLGLTIKYKNNFEIIDELNRFLIKSAKKGKNVAIIIDEAQNLSIDQLEQLRLLSNLETEKDKLLQIILVGQPELQQKIQLHELRQLRQRIAIQYHLQPLEARDIAVYVNQRIKNASEHKDLTKSVTFTERALELIYQYTKGMPRTINILCDRVLLAGFSKETYFIDESIIETSAKEVLYCEHHL